MASQPGKSRKVSGVIGVASVILVIVTLLAGVLLQFTGLSGAAQAQPSGTIAFHPGFDKTPADALCTTNVYNGISTQTPKPGDPNARQFATAISNPFKGTTDAAVNKENVAETCGNPTVLKQSLDEMTLWKGVVPGADENMAWIEKIQNYIAKHSLDAFSGKNDAGDKIVSPLYQKYAGWVNTVWLRFNAEGLQSLASTRNWELPATVTPGIQPTAVQSAAPDNKPAWVRTLVDKNGKCLYKIGFNAEDKRIETFNCKVSPPPVTPPSGSHTPGCTSNCGGTPGCTSNCTPVHICPPSMPDGTWPVCKDGPTNAPNRSDGNGLSHDPTPATPSPTPTQPPSTPRANPVAPAPTPAPTADPAPAPSPEPSAPAPSAPSTGTSCAPGVAIC